MASALNSTTISLEDAAALQRLCVLLAPLRTAIWQTLFSDAQRQRIGPPPNSGRTLAEAWGQVKGLSAPEAVVDLANRVGLLSPLEYAGLQQRLGVTQPWGPSVPHWDGQSRLTLDGKLLRKVRTYQNASNCQRILDAFQQAGWPASLDLPLGREAKGPVVNQAVHELNKGLNAIRFSVSGGGNAVSWQRRKSK